MITKRFFEYGSRRPAFQLHHLIVQLRVYANACRMERRMCNDRPLCHRNALRLVHSTSES